jgi:lambda family phage portal protein
MRGLIAKGMAKLGFYRAAERRVGGPSTSGAERPNEAFRFDRGEMIRRCIWLYSNNSLFRNSIDKFVASVLPQPIGVRPDGVDGGWRAWSEERRRFSLDGTFEFISFQRLVLRTVAIQGEAFLVFHEVGGDLRVEVIDALALDETYSGKGGRPGIDFGPDGRPTRFHFVNRETNVRRSYPATICRHVYMPLRPGARFGEPLGVAFQADIGTMGEWLTSELRSQALAARISGVASSMMGDAFGPGNGDGVPETVDMRDFTLIRVAPGEDVRFPTRDAPRTSFGDFFARQLQGGSGGMGLTYGQASGDYSATSYASSRMAHLDRLPNTVAWRNWFRDFVVAEVYEEWERHTALRDGRPLDVARLQAAYYRMPGDRMLDPQREQAAAEAALRMGRTSLSDLISADGNDPSEVFDRIAADIAEMQRRGIPVTWFNSIITGKVEEGTND